MSKLYEINYNPDVLSCIANLSNDEVFTPPEVANKMLDMLPQELFTSPDTKFLDPACKSGVFLREITKRLIEGLEDKIPDLRERINHILKNQVYGIAITELTSLLSRRSVYCSKYANSIFSIADFDNVQGNIRFKNTKHKFKDGKCVFCGASESEYGAKKREGLENHAYEMIHSIKPEEILKMKFDVIIGNPPYQLNDGGAQASAVPIYQHFIEQAKKLNPSYLTMIIPARWMTGGRGLDKFRSTMINDTSIQILHDYANSSDCFSGVEIKGGICFFLRNNNYNGKCKIYRHFNDEVRESTRFLKEDGDNIFIREDRLISIKNKVQVFGEEYFENIVSFMKPYGLRGDVFKNPNKYKLPKMSETKDNNYYSIVGLENLKRTYRFVPKEYPIPTKSKSLDKWKLFVTRNWGIGSFDDIPSSPIIAGPCELCTETFVEFGPFNTRCEVENVYSYLCTKFFRALVAIRKQDQGSSKAVYHYVPMQDFSKPWTDEELYAKYGLNDEEINFIESMIKPMELDGDK